jgi:hypothetical protein
MTDPGWGREYGAPFVNEQGEAGIQDGPEHRNVVPALIWAWAQGWADPTTDPVFTAGIRAEIARNTRTRR